MFSHIHGLQVIASIPGSEAEAANLRIISEFANHASHSSPGLQKQQQRLEPHVCILARTCGPQSDCKPNSSQLLAFLLSIMAQTYTNWELHLLNAQGGGEVFENDVAKLQDERVLNGPSNPEAFSLNSAGYEATNFAMKQLLSGASTQKACSYFLFTNADNLYGSTFLETALPGMKFGNDLLGFNFVTRYEQHPGLFDYKLFRKGHMPMQDVGFNKIGHMDLGGALISAEAIQEAQVQFQKKEEREDWNVADWDFFRDIRHRKGFRGSKIYDELLFYHQ